MKKTLSCLLAVLVLFASLSVAVSAETACGCGHAPIVFIDGFNASDLILDRGTDHETVAFPFPAEGVVNLMLSLFLVNAFPADCKVAGVVAATIVTTLTICDIVEPYVVFHHVFDKGPGSFYLKSYAYVALFVAALLVVDSLSMPCRDDVTGRIMNGGVSLAVSAATLGLLALVDRAFRDEVAALAHAATGWVRARMRSA